jgi:translocation and assembly module TamA
VDLLRFTANLRYIATPAPRHRLVGRTALGVAEIANGDRTDLAPSLNYFAGGSRSIRGFSYQSLGNEIDVTRDDGSTKTLVVGGDRLFTTSLEYQYYFTDKWRGALFADGGDAFDSGEFDWNYAAGFGIHFISPVGALRIELANSLSDDNPDWYLHLNIGAEF